MASAADEPAIIRIAAAIIDDGRGSILLVRKSGTTAFMQPGGKIEADEAPIDALVRELREELGFDVGGYAVTYIGRRSAEAANEQHCEVDAELFHVRCLGPFMPGAEIAECVWMDLSGGNDLPLAPLTRDHVIALATGWPHLRDRRELGMFSAAGVTAQ